MREVEIEEKVTQPHAPAVLIAVKEVLHARGLGRNDKIGGARSPSRSVSFNRSKTDKLWRYGNTEAANRARVNGDTSRIRRKTSVPNPIGVRGAAVGAPFLSMAQPRTWNP